MRSAELSGRFISPRVKWTNDELRIVLGYYYFIYINNTRKKDYYSFADDLRKMTGNSRTNDSVGMRFSNYAFIDPASNSGFAGGYKKCIPIWNECINQDRTPKKHFILMFLSFVLKYGENKDIYFSFLKKYKKYLLDAEKEYIDEDEFILLIRNSENEVREIEMDELADDVTSEDWDEVAKLLHVRSIQRERNAKVKRYTLERAAGFCDLCGEEAPFIKEDGTPYLEVHHLEYLSNNGPDAIYNTVALCPNCHRKLHVLALKSDYEILCDKITDYLESDPLITPEKRILLLEKHLLLHKKKSGCNN